jgi:transcription elongation factor GreA
MVEPIYLTPEGAERMKTELAMLTGPKRVEMAARLRSAIQMGDLSENADYHKAKEDQAFLEGRIMELEYLLKNAIIIEQAEGNRDIVNIGSRVTVQEEDFPPDTYSLVGAKEADPSNYKISYESPIGKALMGKRKGDLVVVETPGGQISLQILRVE